MTEAQENQLRLHLKKLALTGGEPGEPLGSGAYAATIEALHNSALSEDDICMLSSLVIFVEEWESVSPERMLPLHAVIAAALDGPGETQMLNQVITHGWIKPLMRSSQPNATQVCDA